MYVKNEVIQKKLRHSDCVFHSVSMVSGYSFCFSFNPHFTIMLMDCLIDLLIDQLIDWLIEGWMGGQMDAWSEGSSENEYIHSQK